MTKDNAIERSRFRTALRDTFPVLVGYLVLGLGFGIILRASGYGAVWSGAMSLFIYAGSMQYVAIGLLKDGASLATVALTTLAVNARHFFYGISMLEPYRNAGRKKAYLIFGLTDETYSLVCQNDKGTEYAFAVTLLDHIYWVTGSVLGGLLGNAVPFDSTGIDFALTALFITVFTEQWLNSKSHFPAICGVALSVICLLIFGADRFLIPAMAAIAVALILFERRCRHA